MVQLIRDLVMGALAQSSKEGEALAFTTQGEASIKRALATLAKKPTAELADAVETLFSIVDWLEDEAFSPSAAADLIAMIETPAVINALQELTRRAMAEKDAVLKDRRDPLRIAKPLNYVPQEVPADAVKADAFSFPRRM